jgi:hypothetical protein
MSDSIENNITATLTLVEIQTLITNVTQAERITKAGLSSLSRELLAWAWENGTIEPINDLMGLDENGKHRLTPLNWRTAAMYFNTFVAFTSNYESQVEKYVQNPSGARPVLAFNKKSKAKYNRLLPTVIAWLADSANDLWLWSDQNVVMQDKVVDTMALAIKAIVKAMNDDENGYTMGDIIAQVQMEEGVTVNLARTVEAEAEAA